VENEGDCFLWVSLGPRVYQYGTVVSFFSWVIFEFLGIFYMARLFPLGSLLCLGFAFGFGKINCGLRRGVCFAQRATEELWWENSFSPPLPGSERWSAGKLIWKVRELSGLDEGSGIWETNNRRAGIAKVRSVRARPCPAPDYDLPSWGISDCGTVGAGGLPSYGYMMRVMISNMLPNHTYGT